jgi:phage terminase small subunit
MTGKKGRSGGHNKLTTEELLEKGAFVATRHGDPHPREASAPEPVADLGPVGKRCWDAIVASLPPAALCRVDSYKLTLTCQTFELLQEWLAKWKANPAGKQERMSVRQLTADFDRLAIQWGMSPRDRQRLAKIDFEQKAKEQKDPFQEFMDWQT